MLYHQMLREKEVLDQREKNILERLQTYPAGKLIYSQNGKHKKWYISCDGQKIYIPSNEKNTAVSMAEKKYYEVMLQDIVQEKRAIQSYLDLCNKEQTGEEQLLETAVYAELLKKVFTSVNTAEHGGNGFLVWLFQPDFKGKATGAERLTQKDIDRCGKVHA